MKHSSKITLCAVLLSVTALAGNGQHPAAVTEAGLKVASAAPLAITTSSQVYHPGQQLWTSVPRLGVVLVSRGAREVDHRWVYLVDVERRHVQAVRVDSSSAYRVALSELTAPSADPSGRGSVIIGDIIIGTGGPPPPPSGDGWVIFSEQLLTTASRLQADWLRAQGEVQSALSGPAPVPVPTQPR